MDKDIQLRNFLKSNSNRPFVWGLWDCVLFAGTWSDVRTGRKNTESFIGKYSDALGSIRVLKDVFNGKFDSIMDQYHMTIPHQLAGTGDILYAVMPNGHHTYGIADGDKCVFAGESGLVSYRRTEIYIEKAWRVD